MRGFLLLAWLPFLACPVTDGLEMCPPSDAIAPCACVIYSTEDIDIDCMNAETAEDIYRAFNDVTWDFKEMRSLIGELPEGVFADVSFQEFILYDNIHLQSIHSSALLPSIERLEVLHAGGSHRLHLFPFEILPQMTALKALYFGWTNFPEVPILRSNSLETLNFWNSPITSLGKEAWSMPNLKSFILGKNRLRELPQGLVTSMEKLVTFQCNENHLGPHLQADYLEFKSPDLATVNLDGNDISTLAPGAITGLGANTTLSLYRNSIEFLEEESFRPIVEVMVSGTGTLNVRGNPLACGCEILWLVTNEPFRPKVLGTCKDDYIQLQDLDPQPFLDLCTVG
ncbi:unnamed protein product [Darwinula stevensoni]|uniref:Oplophorus-luciferin 2-monooxygenase non-catalytic subunit n=1 Tax=Darwinula stevensoni TaxID=69355 RepID=A0A7R9AAZ2_9CRUS|nr:unnamed protein product [Darwinula stevensoni]CAG0898898.1 unnamed protein product [Darwinula stevensoni]